MENNLIKTRGRDKFAKYKSIISFFVVLNNFLPRRLRISLFTAFRNTSGIFGIVIRYVLLKTLAKKVGDNVLIQPGCYLLNVHELSIGNNVSIQPMCYIEALGGVSIGDNVSIAHLVTIMSTEHNYIDVCTPIKEQPLYLSSVTILDDVWIGAKSTILKGVTILPHTVIGANSLVNKPLERGGIYVGSPVRFLKLQNVNV